ncbi:TPA: helix-turn-helix domain-containing protein [Streptococcus agalactiae]
MKTQYPMIPFPLIVKATDGDTDTEAINQILHHYRGYITKRSLRLMKDEYGNQSMVVDEVLRGRMETRLITKILSFEIK